MITTSDLMKRHGIERVVFVPATVLVPHDEFHAWGFEYSRPEEMCGIGPTVEAAIFDLVARKAKAAA